MKVLQRGGRLAIYEPLACDAVMARWASDE
jgi:hypothetical protein